MHESPIALALSEDTEAEKIRIRVVALENLVIALLAQAPAAQLELARAMATYISPRPGYTPHPLTLRAADEMRSLVDRATQFRTTPSMSTGVACNIGDQCVVGEEDPGSALDLFPHE